MTNFTKFLLPLFVTASAFPALSADYYVDPVNGSDSNAGTLESPWKSSANFNYYRNFTPPTNWVSLQPGDRVFFRGGLYQDLIQPGDIEGWDERLSILTLRSMHGTESEPITFKAYPGETPVFDGQNMGDTIEVLNSSNLIFEGIEVIQGQQNGIHIDDVQNITVLSCKVSETYGNNYDNGSGMYVKQADNIQVINCEFENNYDRTRTGKNDTNLVFFLGSKVTVANCRFSQDVANVFGSLGGGGVKYKQSSQDTLDTSFQLYNNTFENMRYFSLASGSLNTYFHHNELINSFGVDISDQTNDTVLNNARIENNNFVDSYTVFNMDTPLNNCDSCSFPVSTYPQNINFINNTIIDQGSSYSAENSPIRVGTYMDDTVYSGFIDELTVEGNLYHNPSTSLLFNIGANNATAGNTLGDLYEFSQWQALGYDDNESDLNEFITPDQSILFFTKDNQQQLLNLTNSSEVQVLMNDFSTHYGKIYQEDSNQLELRTASAILPLQKSSIVSVSGPSLDYTLTIDQGSPHFSLNSNIGNLSSGEYNTHEVSVIFNDVAENLTVIGRLRIDIAGSTDLPQYITLIAENNTEPVSRVDDYLLFEY